MSTATPRLLALLVLLLAVPAEATGQTFTDGPGPATGTSYAALPDTAGRADTARVTLYQTYGRRGLFTWRGADGTERSGRFARIGERVRLFVGRRGGRRLWKRCRPRSEGLACAPPPSSRTASR